MKHDVNDIVVNQFTRSLNALKNILKKAKSHAEERKFDPNMYLDMRLAPDMFPLSRQVQIVTDNAKGAVARLTGKTAPVFEDGKTTLDELLARIDKTIDFLATTKAEDFADYASKKASFHWKPDVYMMGDDYLVSHVIPTFYFHMTTTYALLRQCGVHIGKADYLGEQNWKK